MANAQLDIRFVTNRLGNQNLVHNGYKFRVKYRRRNRCYWTCTTSNCPATMNTLDNIPTKMPTEHNHPNHQTELKVEEVLRVIKKRCGEDTLPIPSIYEEEVCKLRNREWDEDMLKVVEQLPTFQSCKGRCYNERAKLIPALPTSRTNINLQGPWRQTTTGEEFLVADDGEDDRILMFTTRQNLEHLTSADTIYGDGTFYICPELFTQLYTFHAFVNDAIHPLVFALLPGKSEGIYTRFLTLLKETCQRQQLRLQPRTLYEVAIRNAAYTVFPGIAAKGCFFHYTQCIWRKVQSIGLQNHYMQNDDIRQLVRRAAVLPLVPMEHVEDVWFNALEDIGVSDVNINTDEFTDYITEFWVERNRHLWNHYETDGPRTTNHLEGWHLKLKNQVHHSHPNIYKLITILQRQQASTEIKIIQYAAGGKRVPRKRKYVEIDDRLDTLKDRLQNDLISVVEFADAALYLLHLE